MSREDDVRSEAAPPLPTTLVPRWLAALVLAALLAAGALSAWLVLHASAHPVEWDARAQRGEAERSRTQADAGESLVPPAPAAREDAPR